MTSRLALLMPMLGLYAVVDSIDSSLSVGDLVRVRNGPADHWQPGQVTKTSPLLVKVDGSSAPTAWTMVDPFPIDSLPIASRKILEDDEQAQLKARSSNPKLADSSLSVGDLVRVRNGLADRWQPGQVTKTSPLLVKVVGTSVPTAWAMVDPFPIDILPRTLVKKLKDEEQAQFKARFEVAALGSSACTANHTSIVDASKCKEAAASMDLVYIGSEVWFHVQPGCVMHNTNIIWFNSATVGAQNDDFAPICQESSCKTTSDCKSKGLALHVCDASFCKAPTPAPGNAPMEVLIRAPTAVPTKAENVQTDSAGVTQPAKSTNWIKQLSQPKPVRNMEESIKVGDLVRVRNGTYEHWKPGKVVQTSPVLVSVDGVSQPLAWNEIDRFPMQLFSEYPLAGHVRDVKVGDFVRVRNNTLAEWEGAVVSSIHPFMVKTYADGFKTETTGWKFVDPTNDGVALGIVVMFVAIAILARNGWLIEMHSARKFSSHELPLKADQGASLQDDEAWMASE